MRWVTSRALPQAKTSTPLLPSPGEVGLRPNHLPPSIDLKDSTGRLFLPEYLFDTSRSRQSLSLGRAPATEPLRPPVSLLRCVQPGVPEGRCVCSVPSPRLPFNGPADTELMQNATPWSPLPNLPWEPHARFRRASPRFALRNIQGADQVIIMSQRISSFPSKCFTGPCGAPKLLYEL